LLLGDAGTRRHEIAVRAALGGARRQVARQLFAESLLLAAAAGVLGVVVAAWLTPTLVSLAPTTLPMADTVRLDQRVFLFAVLVTLGSSLLFGVGPALWMSSADPAEALREGGRSGVQRSRGYRWVVAGQVAMATMLLVGAGLLVETVRQMTSQPLGFDPDRLAVAAVRLPPVPSATAAQRAERTQVLVDRLAALREVEHAAATSTVPFSGNSGSNSFQIPGRTFERDPTANRHVITEDYFATLGIPVAKGRTFDSRDQSGAFAAVVTDEFERVLMEGEALGKRFVLNGNEHTIIGVVPAAKHRRYTDQQSVAFYLLSRQLPGWSLGSWIVRLSGEPADQLPAVRRAILEVEPQAAFVTFETMDAMMRRSIAAERYRAVLALAFGLLAVLLSGIGLYGLVARSVSDRRREMGVRIALGAHGGEIRRLVFRHAFGLVALGVAVGVPAAVLTSRGLASMLFGVTPTSLPVVLIAVITMAGAGLLATVGPALRATRINPIDALRGQ